jgi:hypothetical protein
MWARTYLKEPTIYLKNIQKSSQIFDPKLGNHVPSVVDIHYSLTPILLCVRCEQIYNPRRYISGVCMECGSDLIFYRGPYSSTIELDKDKFVPEMVSGNLLTFKFKSGNTIDVVTNLSWAALARSYKDGVYSGFILIQLPHIRSQVNHRLTGILLTPLQAAFYEKYSIVRKGIEEQEIHRKKNAGQDLTIPLTARDLIRLGIFQESHPDMELLLKIALSSKERFHNNRSEWVYSSLS